MPEENDDGTNDRDEEKNAGARPAEEVFEDEGEEEDGPEGMRGYESEHEPGGRVRVARMTRDLEEEAESESEAAGEGEESDEEQDDSRFDVTVRGEGPTRRDRRDETDADEGSGEADADQGPSEDDEGDDGEGDRAMAAEEQVGDATAGASEEFDPSLEIDEVAGGSETATTEDFAQMFEGAGVPERREYSTGDRIEGEVLEIGDRFIFVQLDPQTEGAAKRREFEDDEGELELEVGETHEFYVTYVDEDDVQLGRQLEGDEGSLDAIREAHEKGVPVEGKVTGTNKGGFEVVIHGVDAFCPISEIEIGFTEEKEIHVGAKYRFKVTEVRDGGDSVVVSRAQILREERAEEARKTLENLEKGDVVDGIVTRTTNFGAFVDLGGVEGLVHISELSHRHFDRASDVVEEGEKVEVEVLEIEMPEESDDADGEPRISLSRKATETDPWEVVNRDFAVGETVEGTVVRNAPFGAFIEIAPGVEGLCHVSEMSWTEHVRTPDDIVEPGDKVTVQVQDIDLPRKRVSLSIKGAEGDPWDEVGETYAVGMAVEGEVENIEDFGVFVKLPTGITALIPRSELNLPSGVTPFRKFSEGEQVEAEVLNIDPAERKMALTPRSEETRAESGASSDGEGEQGEEADAGGPPPSASGGEASEGSFGTLGDLIGDELQDDS